MLKYSGIHLKYLYIIRVVGSFGLFSDNDRSIMFTVYDATNNMRKYITWRRLIQTIWKTQIYFNLTNTNQMQTNSKAHKKENARRQSKHNPSLMTHVNIKIVPFF